jgi:hypothetical protein
VSQPILTTHAEALARGREYRQAGDVVRAEEVYRGILRTDSRAAGAWLALASCARPAGA